MNWGHAERLNADRSALNEAFTAFESRLDEDAAEALRPTLTQALSTLKALYQDEEVWATAASVAGSPGAIDLVPAGDLAESLPPLLDLFGYRAPPPPPAQQLVAQSIALLRSAEDEAEPRAEVAEARRMLGDLLERTLPLVEGDVKPPSWKVAKAASETIPALEAGVSIATGAATGAVGIAVTSVMAGALTGGLGALGAVLVLGGVRRWRRRRARQQYEADLALHREKLDAQVLPAAQGALLYHLDSAVELLSECASREDPLLGFDLDIHFGQIMDLTRRFALDDQLLTAETNRGLLKGRPAARNLLITLREAHMVATTARSQLAITGGVDNAQVERLSRLVEKVRAIDLDKS